MAAMFAFYLVVSLFNSSKGKISYINKLFMYESGFCTFRQILDFTGFQSISQFGQKALFYGLKVLQICCKLH
jgi:hypothetical protein